VACEHLQTPITSLITGASAMLMPFRPSLPQAYRCWPANAADVIAIRGDWAICNMDYSYVCRAKLPPVESGQQVLFDLDRPSP